MATSPQLNHVAVDHAVVRLQPRSASELAERLSNAYTVDGGAVSLANLSLAFRPFVRLSYRSPKIDGDAPACDCQTPNGHLLIDEDLKEVKPALAESLDMLRTAPLIDEPPPCDGDLLERMLDEAAARAAHLNQVELLSATFLWYAFAEGTLRLEIADQWAPIPFADWAVRLKAPPFACPATGQRSHHIVATDSGRITVAEAIAVCQESGRLALATELVDCSATGRRVLSELTVTCPVTYTHVLKGALGRCAVCQQRVSPTTLDKGRCVACRTPKPIAYTDPLMIRVFAAHRGLARWRRWRCSQTSAVYVLFARDWRRQLAVVLDKTTLEPLSLASRGRWFGVWRAVSPERQGELLDGI